MTFGLLALIVAAGLVGSLLALPRGWRVPVVVGELVLGLALGASGLDVLDATDPTFSFVAQVGFALVMFVAGSQVPVRDPALRAGLAVGVRRAVVVGVLSVPVALGLAALTGGAHPWLYAVLLASSSAALVLPALRGASVTGANTSKAVAELVPQVAIADAACIVLLPLVIDPAHLGRAALGGVVVCALAVVAWLALRHVERSGQRKGVHEVSERRGLALELRVSLVLLFALAAVATLMHVSVMLAGFSLGVAVGAVGEPRRLARQLFALTEGFLGPVFFVWLGASLDLHDLASHPSAIGLGVGLGVAAVLVHGAGVLTRQPWPFAVMSAAQLGVPVAAATIGTSLGVLAPGEAAALLLGALVTIAALSLASLKAPGEQTTHAAAPG